MNKFEELSKRQEDLNSSLKRLKWVTKSLSMLYNSNVIINELMSSLGMLFTILEIQGAIIGVFLSLAVINGIYLLIKLTKKKRKLAQLNLLSNKIRILKTLKLLELSNNPDTLQEVTIFYNCLIEEIENTIELENKLDKIDQKEGDSTDNVEKDKISASNSEDHLLFEKNGIDTDR